MNSIHESEGADAGNPKTMGIQLPTDALGTTWDCFDTSRRNVIRDKSNTQLEHLKSVATYIGIEGFSDV